MFPEIKGNEGKVGKNGDRGSGGGLLITLVKGEKPFSAQTQGSSRYINTRRGEEREICFADSSRNLILMLDNSYLYIYI